MGLEHLSNGVKLKDGLTLRMGNLILGDIQPGQVRELTGDERAELLRRLKLNEGSPPLFVWHLQISVSD